jgi:hypothetical protein
VCRVSKSSIGYSITRRFSSNRVLGYSTKLLDTRTQVINWKFTKFSHNFCQVFTWKILITKYFHINQTCPNVAFGGSSDFSNWGTSSPDMTLKFGTQIKEVKRGPRNFFGVRIFSGDFSMRLQRNLVASGFWATGKTYKAEILHTAFLVQFRTSEFYSAQ